MELRAEVQRDAAAMPVCSGKGKQPVAREQIAQRGKKLRRHPASCADRTGARGEERRLEKTLVRRRGDALACLRPTRRSPGADPGSALAPELPERHLGSRSTDTAGGRRMDASVSSGRRGYGWGLRELRMDKVIGRMAKKKKENHHRKS
nr:unnamed protein product [Digitaria exilis]